MLWVKSKKRCCRSHGTEVHSTTTLSRRTWKRKKKKWIERTFIDSKEKMREPRIWQRMSISPGQNIDRLLSPEGRLSALGSGLELVLLLSARIVKMWWTFLGFWSAIWCMGLPKKRWGLRNKRISGRMEWITEISVPENWIKMMCEDCLIVLLKKEFRFNRSTFGKLLWICKEGRGKAEWYSMGRRSSRRYHYSL